MINLGYDIANNQAKRASQMASTRLAAKVNREMLMLKKAIRKLEKNIISSVAKLQQAADGTLVGPRVNLKQAQKLHTALTYQFEEIYGTAIKKHVKGYGQVSDWVIDNFKDLDIATEWTDIDLTMIQSLQKQALLGFVQIGDAARTKVQQALYNSIAAQTPFSELVNTISSSLTGKFSKSGIPLSNYASLYANDGIMNFYNSVHLQKGEDVGIEHYLYSGTIMANTRDFCRKRVGKVFSLEKINSWVHKWTGKSGPALTHRGGWNCRHHWQAVKPEWVPDLMDEEEERGIVVPTDAEKKRAMEVGGLKFDQLTKVQRSHITKIGQRLKKGNMNAETKYLESWDLLSHSSKSNQLAKWSKKGYNIPDNVDWLSGKTYKPKIKLPPKIKKPKKIPTKITSPEQIITGPITATPAEAGLVEALDDGMTWKQLSAKQKSQVGKVATLMEKGKYNPKSVYVKTWGDLSIETQQMKLAQWKAKGVPIHPSLPIKGPGNTAKNIIDASIKEGNEKFASQIGIMDNTFDDIAKKMDDSWHIPDLDYSTYDSKTGAQLFSQLDDELTRMSDEFADFGKILNNEYSNISKISVVESSTVSDSACGVYRDVFMDIKIGGKLPKVHSGLTRIGNADELWNAVGTDYYSTFRHEIGHHIDNALRRNWSNGVPGALNHQEEWRKIYKSFDKNEWRKLFGNYTSTSKYEGFAEVFKIYTSPKYKAGVMPYNIEKYLHKVLGGGKLAKPAEKAIKGAAQLSKVFASPKNQKRYEELFQFYRKKGLDAEDLKKVIKVRCPNIYKSLGSWMNSTQGYHPSAMKLRMEKLLDDKHIKWIASESSRMGSGSAAKKIAQMARDDFADEEFLQLRAIVQEYYDRKGIKHVKLFRGTGGVRSGPALRKKISDLKKTIPEEDWAKTFIEFEESSLNGWSPKQSLADSFGLGQRGVTVGTNIPVDDIFIPHSLWSKSGAHVDEFEYVIIRRTNQQYSLLDVHCGFSEKKKMFADLAEDQFFKKQLGDWVDKTPSVLSSTKDIQEAILLYSKNIVPNYAQNTDVLLDKLLEKLSIIEKNVLKGESIKFGKGLGKVISAKDAKKAQKIFAEFVDDFEDIEMGGEIIVGWVDALKTNKLEHFFESAKGRASKVKPIKPAAKKIVDAIKAKSSRHLQAFVNATPDVLTEEGDIKESAMAYLKNKIPGYSSTPAKALRIIKKKIKRIRSSFVLDGSVEVIAGKTVSGSGSFDILINAFEEIEKLLENLVGVI